MSSEQQDSNLRIGVSRRIYREAVWLIHFAFPVDRRCQPAAFGVRAGRRCGDQLAPGAVTAGQRRRQRPAHVVVVDGQHGRISLGEFGQLLGRHRVQPAGAFTLAGDDHLAGVAAVAGNVERGAGLQHGVAQPVGLSVQQRPRRLGERDLLLGRDVPPDLHDLVGRVAVEGQA